MKRDRGLLIAGAAGLLAVLSFLAYRRLMKSDEYRCYHSDFHNYFNDLSEEDFHGVEYMSLR